MYSNLLTQVTSDLADEGKQCRCALIGTLTAGINVCAFQKEDLKIPGSEGACREAEYVCDECVE